LEPLWVHTEYLIQSAFMRLVKCWTHQSLNANLSFLFLRTLQYFNIGMLNMPVFVMFSNVTGINCLWAYLLGHCVG